jgi:hypothetical protein
LRTTIGVGPFPPTLEGFVGGLEAVVRQGERRVRRDDEAIGRADLTFGPVKLERAVRIVVKNTGMKAAAVDVLVDWS